MTNLESSNPHFARNVILKAVLLFGVFNLVFVLGDPLPRIGRLSAYNHVFPGRIRLPYADDPSRAYSLSLFNLEAMFASHELSGGPKPAGEYRVILIGDSSSWGYLLPPDQTLSAFINQAGLRLPDERQVRAYNLGYPVMSLTKDLVILSFAMRYQPDLIIWPLTLESFPYDKQLFPPLLQHNPEPVRELIRGYNLHLNPDDPQFKEQEFWARSILGQRRELADLLRLQLYGVMWAATRVDQDLPANFTPRMEDLPADEGFHNLQPPQLHPSDLALDILQAGINRAGTTPVLIVNEPMFVSQGQNSDIRYNFFYPRWAYDDYRKIMAETGRDRGWLYVDAWDAVPPKEFTNSAVHMTPEGTAAFAKVIQEAILKIAQ